MFDAEIDIAIAGAGGCGLTAALAASQAPLEIGLFEKTDRLMGNTAMSAGLIPAAGTICQRELGIGDSPDVMAEDILKKNHYESDRDLVMALCRESADLIHWMKDDLDIELSLLEEFKYPGQSFKRMHGTKLRSGAELIKLLSKKLKQRSNVYLSLKSELKDVIRDEKGRIIGIEVTSNGEILRVKCKKLILATNGFGGNKTWIQKYIPEMKDALYFGYEANSGTGIELGEKAGAELKNMGAYQGHSSVVESHGILLTWGTVMLGGFLVNKEGKRFGDETKGYSEFAKEILNQTDQNAYVIFNEEIRTKLLRIDDFAKLDALEAFKTADRVEELGNKLGISSDSLKETFQQFLSCREKEADGFGRTSYESSLSGTLYGVKVAPALFHTQGGLKINQYAQVLEQKGNPIPNLYAGGGAAEGISGRHDYGYMSGNGLLSALGFGRIAGYHASMELMESFSPVSAKEN